MRISDRLIWSGDGFDGQDRTMIVAHPVEMIMALISSQSDHDRVAIGPRSRSDQTTIASRSGYDLLMIFPPSDEDRTATSRSRI